MMTNNRLFKQLGLALSIATTIAVTPALAAAPNASRLSQAHLNAIATDQVLTTTRTRRQANYVKGEVIVRFSASAQSGQNRQALAALSAQASRAVGRSGYHLIQLKPGQSVEQALRAYGVNPAIAHVEPNYIAHAMALPNDPDFGQLWGLQNIGQKITNGAYPNNPPLSGIGDINVESGWDLTTDCSSVTVAVLDTGINYTHQDLAANMWDDGSGNHGYDVVDDDSNPMPTSGTEQHGTHVAGIIGAVGNNATGVTGVCWKASIMSVRVLGPDGLGSVTGIAEGINWAVDNGAEIINMSLGGLPTSSMILSDAIDYARDQDVLVVVAAGNGGDDGVGDELGVNPSDTANYPCSFEQDNLLCVAALDQAYELADFSNFGGEVVDLGAPGTNIVSSWGGETIVDPMDGANWFLSTGSDWKVVNCIGDGTSVFVNPSTWCDVDPYATNADEQRWKTFSFSALVSTLGFAAEVNIVDGEHFFRVRAVGSGANPFDPVGGTELNEWTGLNDIDNYSFDLNQAGCGSGDCTIGFQLQTNGTPPTPGTLADPHQDGIEISDIKITTIQQNSASYDVASGTSQATPYVTGVAALVRAFSPDFTVEDTYNALIKGGRDVPALATTTTSGRAVDALGALSWIDAPSAPTVQVVP